MEQKIAKQATSVRVRAPRSCVRRAPIKMKMASQFANNVASTTSPKATTVMARSRTRKVRSAQLGATVPLERSTLTSTLALLAPISLEPAQRTQVSAQLAMSATSASLKGRLLPQRNCSNGIMETMNKVI